MWGKIHSIFLSFSILISFFNQTGHGQQNISLIAGFEKEELQQWANLSDWLTFTQLADDTLQLERRWIRTYYFTKGNTTQGEFALFKKIDEEEFAFNQTMLDSTREPDGTYGDREWYIERLGYLFRAFQWFRDVFEKDWSNWDFMWIDVLSTEANAIIRVLIEDRWEASSIRRFEIPAGQFVTIKFRLKDVATIGEIDLTDMNNFWITLEETDAPTTIYIDNVRLTTLNATKDDGIPFVTDESPITKRTIPIANIEPINRPIIEKDTTPITDPNSPILIDILNIIDRPFLGNEDWGNHERAISAFDNNRLLIILNGTYKDTFGIYAIGSLDGGSTWKGIDGLNTPTFISNGRNIRHHGAFEDSDRGDGFLITMRHCYYIGGLANALFYKLTFLGDHWIVSPEIICYNYMRGCPMDYSFTCLPDTTYWTAFNNLDNIDGVDIHAVLSSDQGETWKKVAKSPRINNTSSYSSAKMFLTPYEKSVACIWKRAWNQLTWACYDNGQWIEQGLIESADVTVYTLSSITVNSNQIFIALKIDGKLYVSHSSSDIWQKDLIDDGGEGRILNSILTVSGRIPYCIWAQEIKDDNYGLYYRRYNSNQNIWESKCEIISGESDEIINLATPVHSPINYIPLLYDSAPIGEVNSDEFWLKLIKISVDTLLAPAVPNLAMPSDGAILNETVVNISWHSAADAESYQVQLSNDENFSSLIFDQSSLNDTTTVVSNLVDSTTFYWRVRANNNSGNSPWSTVWSFKIDTAVPVELSHFSFSVLENTVKLIWITMTESDNYGFDVERAHDNSEFIKIGFVQGSGTTVTPQNYYFIDKELSMGTYQYRLKQIDIDGNFEYSEVIEVSISAPKQYTLEQNYPNPFNSKTYITYNLSNYDIKQVNLSIYNIMEQEVRILVNTKQSAGNYSVLWDGKNNEGIEVPSGIYLYKLKIDNYFFSRKMLLIK